MGCESLKCLPVVRGMEEQVLNPEASKEVREMLCRSFAGARQLHLAQLDAIYCTLKANVADPTMCNDMAKNYRATLDSFTAQLAVIIRLNNAEQEAKG